MVHGRVALDARYLGLLNEGLGEYVYQLGRHLPEVAPEYEYLLLVDRPIVDGRNLDKCREVVVGRPFSGGRGLYSLYHPWWLNVLLPPVLKREDVILYHATTSFAPVRAPCPVVTTVHDLAFLRVPEAFGPRYRFYMRIQVPVAVRAADAIILDSESAKRDLVAFMGTPAADTEVIQLGLDADYRVVTDSARLSQVREELSLPDRFILHVGVIETRKNLSVLLRAALGPLREGLADAVVFAGKDRRGAEDVRKAVRDLRLTDRVIFLGHVSSHLLPGLYNLAQVMAFPSLYEGFGFPVLEAMACGTPVLASSASSIPEVAGDAALLFNPTDADELEKLLRQVLTDDRLRDELRTRGLRHVRRFSWERCAAAHAGVFRRVMAFTERSA